MLPCIDHKSVVLAQWLSLCRCDVLEIVAAYSQIHSWGTICPAQDYPLHVCRGSVCPRDPCVIVDNVDAVRPMAMKEVWFLRLQDPSPRLTNTDCPSVAGHWAKSEGRGNDFAKPAQQHTTPPGIS